MAITIKDVAREANVSVASVSRALNGHDSITEDTRKRILAAAAKLRYIPHSAARSLITRRTQTIGAVLPDLHGEFFSELIRGIDLAARARGLHLLVSSSHGDAEEAAVAVRAMRGRVDGLLVMAPNADAGFLEDNLPAALPTVLMNTHGGGAHAALNVDNYAGARAMMRHLFACGYRRIAHITGPANNYDAQERLRGYRDTLKMLVPTSEPLVLPGDFSEESGYRAGHELVAMHERPDAVFAANDMMAIGCLYAFNEAHLRVPEHIALTGFDDVPIARFVSPPLTTVRVSIAELGTQALDALAAAIEQPEQAQTATRTLAPELVVRTSCGAGNAAEGGKASTKPSNQKRGPRRVQP